MGQSYREANRDLQRYAGTRTLAIAIAVALFLLLIGQRSVAKGLVLGTLFSVLNFALMGAWLPLMLGRSSLRTRASGFFSVLARYCLLAVPLIIAVKSADFSVVAVGVGLVAVQIFLVVESVLGRAK